MTSPLLRLAGWTLLLGAVLVGLLALGQGPLATPPVSDPGAWASWAALADPVVVPLALARAAAVAVTTYLLAVTLLGALARLLRLARLVAVVDLVSVPSVRRRLQSALGIGLATVALTGVASPLPARAGPALPAHPAAAATDPTVPDRLPVDAPAELPAAQPRTAATTPRSVDAAEPDRWTVAAGEHFWSAATATLRAAWGRTPTEAETAAYWRVLVAHNQARLIDPTNPDLVLPGQVFDLPPVPEDRDAAAS